MRELLIFGSCAASQVALGMVSLQKEHLLPYEMKIGYWAAPAEEFTEQRFFHEFSDRVILSRSVSDEIATKTLFNHGIDDKMESWIQLPSTLELPLPGHEDCLYIFASPIFPFNNFIELMMAMEKGFLPSNNFIIDLITTTVSPQMSMLKKIMELGLEVIVVEGPRLFRLDVSPYIFQSISKSYKSIVSEFLKRYSIPLVEIDENEILDHDGFTLELYRKKKGDCIHANSKYGIMIAKNLAEFLQTRIECDRL